MKKVDVAILIFLGPPNSPPMNGSRLIRRTHIQIKAKQQNTVTEKASDPGFTLNSVLYMACLMAAIVHATPIPRNTFTALLPVTFPIDESAYRSLMAATLLAKVSEIKNK